MDKAHKYCLILAGGVGSRLWPVSRSTRPKQFLDLLGTGRTLIQQTYDRVSKFVDPDNIYISTNVQYLPLVYEQLPEVDDVHILEEPLRRGSLSAVAWGAVVMSKVNPKACVLVTPSDQMIKDEDDFQRDVERGMEFASTNDNMLVMGIRPTRPDTGYGYIQTGEETDRRGIYKVKTFTEKPEQDFANVFVNEGDFLWNTGLHVFRVDVMLESLYALLPEYQMEIPRMMADAESADPKLVPEFFKMLPNLSVDMGILERSDNVCVMECSFDWADLGTWSSIKNDAPCDSEGNVLLGTKAHLYDCKDNVVCLPSGRVAVIKGLTDYVVAEDNGYLMICPREDVAAMRKMHTDTKFS